MSARPPILDEPVIITRPMNQHGKPPVLCASSVTSEKKEYVLSILRVVSARLKLIDAEVSSVGVALSRGLITPGHAPSAYRDSRARLLRHGCDVRPR